MVEAALRARIKADGAIPLADFMQMVITHYYREHASIGTTGDFVTSPELGQLFGEMLSVWLIQAWHRLGQPSPWQLVELGAGQGTLLTDIQRIMQRYPAMTSGLSYQVVEASPKLQAVQAAAWQGLPVTWVEDVDQLQVTSPFILIANEFLDALPVEQYVYHNGAWRTRCVMLQDETFIFSLGSVCDLPIDGKEGDVREFSPMRVGVMAHLARLLRQHRGAAAIIDYGYTTPQAGDSVQGVYQHQSVPPLSHLGHADLTAHVDFAPLVDVAHQHQLDTHLSTQATFLHRLGLRERVYHLAKNATPSQQAALHAQYQRLTAADAMGSLFHVLEVYHD